jgi:hypothetical protein
MDPILLTKRIHTKSATYHRRKYNPNGVIVNDLGLQFASYFSDEGSDDEDTGQYAYAMEYVNSQIYFADIREGILVRYTEEGSRNASGSGNGSIGQVLAYGSFNGSDDTCRGVVVKDAVGVSTTMSGQQTQRENITRKAQAEQVYAENTTNSMSLNLATSDRSGLCGGLSFSCFAWGGFGVVDGTKPFNCTSGEFVELYRTDNLEQFQNEWENPGTLRALDSYDNSVFRAAFRMDGHFSDESNVSVEYPVFVNIDPLPHGSWCTDVEGNTFYSMFTKDRKVFNKLNTEDPQKIAGLQEFGDGVVFYPVAPS